MNTTGFVPARTARRAPRHARDLLGAMMQQPAGAVGAIILLATILVAVFAPLISPYGLGARVGPGYGAPSAQHLLGLDDIGADVLSLLIWGAQTSMLIGTVSAAFAIAIGGFVGIASGYFVGRVDTLLSGLTDYFLVIPVLPLAVLAAALWGPNMRNEIIIIAALSWPLTARPVRAQAKSLQARTYVVRARAVGASNARIILRHVLPGVVPLLMASGVIAIGNAIFFDAALSFLGLGQFDRPSWGTMIAQAFNNGAVGAGAWWAVVSPGIAIGIVVLGTSMVGRLLEQRANPRLRMSHVSAATFQTRAVPRSDIV